MSSRIQRHDIPQQHHYSRLQETSNVFTEMQPCLCVCVPSPITCKLLLHGGNPYVGLQQISKL